MINLKKSLVITLLVLLISISMPLNINAFSVTSNMESELMNLHKAPQHSREELNQDIFMTLLLPSIQNTVDNYYKEYLTVSPIIAPYDVTILSADRVGGYRRFEFLLKLELHPYLGPHLSVGMDYITLRVSLSDIKAEKFEHIKSYELPPHYQDSIKKKLP